MNIKESQNYSLIVEVLFLTQIEKRIDALVNRLINIPAYHRCSLSSCCCHPAVPDHLHGPEGRGRGRPPYSLSALFFVFLRCVFAIGRNGAPRSWDVGGQLKENAEKGGRFLCFSPDF